MTALVDANIFIDQLRGVDQAEATLRDLGRAGPVRASVLSRAEVRAGARGRAPGVERLIGKVVWEAVSEEIADAAGDLARHYGPRFPGISMVDYLVAATAQHLGLRLVTRNVRHFPMFPGLEPPY